MSLLIRSLWVPPRPEIITLTEEPHFDVRAVRRADDTDWRTRRVKPGRFAVRSDLAGFKVADARRALSGLPGPGDYLVAIKALRYRHRPHLAGLCEFDERRIVLSVPEPFHAFDELVYHSARRRPGEGMRFRWVSEKVSFRTRRDVLRFVYL